MTTSTPARFSLLMVLGLFLLAVVGVGLIVLAVASLSRAPAARPTATVTLAGGDAVVFIPTTTPLPPTAPPTATLEPTAEAPPTETPSGEAPPPTEAPAVVRIVGPANVRSGPGLTYAVLGGLNSGDTAPVAGRDATSQWYAISFAGGANGVGWVSNLVATYDGDVQALPVMAANEPPPAASAPPAAPAATNTSPAPAAPTNTSPPPISGARGIVANFFSIENPTAGAGADVWFNFEVRNTTQGDVGYGVLAAHTDVGFTAQSWTNETLKAGQTLTWRDHINIGTPGTYQVYLGICFSSREACVTGGAPWERLSDSITVTIQ